VFDATVCPFPDLYRRFATAFLSDRPESGERNEQFGSVIRAIGAVCVFESEVWTSPNHGERRENPL